MKTKIALKRLVMVMLLVVICLGGFICFMQAAKDPYGKPFGTCREETFEPNEKNVKYLGRSVYENESLWMLLSGTGAEFEFYGTAASIQFWGDNTALKVGGDQNNRARIAVYLDGERILDFLMDEMQKDIEIANFDEPGWHRVKVVKLSEAGNSTVGIHSITVNGIGKIRPTKEKDLLVEVIGDSITCGYGVDDENKDHHFSTATEDVTKTYAYLAMEELDADYSFVSYSGHGILSGYCITPGQKNTQSTIGQYYELAGNSGSYYRGSKASEKKWDFGKQPDYVIINLGTNDASYTKGDTRKEKDFEEEYVKFLKQVRQKNPQAHILCTLGIMGNDLYKNIVNAVEDYQEETGDEKVSCMEFEMQKASDGYGADWHPTYTTHKKASEKLVEEMKRLMQKE